MPKTNETPRTFGVIGDPIAHSLSPAIHNAAFAAQRINAVYLRLHVKPSDVHNVVLAMTLADIEGCNVTTPHKQTITRYLDKLDKSAIAAGAVNTVYRCGKTWVGANTDGVGFIAACKRRKVSLKGKTVTILGAGGAASGIAAALLGAGVHRLILLNRSIARARTLQKKLAKLSRVEIQCAGLTPTIYRRFFPETDILIHATSSGMNATPAITFPITLLPKHSVVCDCQYHPSRTTPLMAMARRLRHPIIEGMDLLLGQAAESYKLWIGRSAPLSAMRRAILKNTPSR